MSEDKLQKIKDYILKKHQHYHKDEEQNWEFKPERPYIDSLELEKFLEELFNKK